MHELDEAEVRLEFRRQYQEKGFTMMTHILAELMIAARICAEIIVEERQRENEEK